MPKLLNVEQAAELLQVPENTVRLWLREERIPGVRIGKRWLISEEDVMSALRVETERDRGLRRVRDQVVIAATERARTTGATIEVEGWSKHIDSTLQRYLPVNVNGERVVLPFPFEWLDDTGATDRGYRDHIPAIVDRFESGFRKALGDD